MKNQQLLNLIIFYVQKQLFLHPAKTTTHDNLLLGSGGREHAFAWKMIQSPFVNFCCSGMQEPLYNTNVDISHNF
jgi:hypothetical protein